MKLFVKILAAVFLLFFGFSVYWQMNDPDASDWMIRYSVGFVGTLLFLFNRLPRWLAITLAIAFFVLAGRSWPETFEGVNLDEGGMKNENIELGRESIGMAISGVIFLLYAALSKEFKR